MTKKLLLGTTALCAAVALSTPASAQVEVTVGGFMDQWFGWGDNDDNNPLAPAGTALAGSLQNVNHFIDSEIIFRFQGQTDNGLTFGGQVQLEGLTSGDQIDESFLFLSGDFGRINIGSENSAPYLMQVSSPNVGLGINSGSNTAFIVNPTGGAMFRSPFGSTGIEAARDNDSEKITYFTPRFEGFQLGVSYAPDIQQDDGGQDPDVFGGAVFETSPVSYNNAISVGANYVNSFDGVDIAIAGGFFYASAEDGAPNVVNNSGVDTSDDFVGLSAGITVGYAGFEAGFSYANVLNGVINGAGTTSTEGQGFDAGIAYTSGPISVSFNGFYGEQESNLDNTADDEYLALQGSVRYALGQGLDVAASIGWTDFEGEAPGAGDDNDGVYITGGVLASF